MQDMRQNGISHVLCVSGFASIFSCDDYFPYYKVFIKSFKLFGI
nr:hypothetical protein [Rickettsia sibirica]